jgi:hypothetical protein
MNRKQTVLIVLMVAALALVAWSPWISGQYAKERAVAEFERAWLNVADGCGFACHGCGAVEAKKVPFGAQVALEYACGLQPADSPENHQQAVVFVSSLGKAYGLPRP